MNAPQPHQPPQQPPTPPTGGAQPYAATPAAAFVPATQPQLLSLVPPIAAASGEEDKRGLDFFEA
ncbi:MAG: hypothetical protein ACPGWS_04000, partial [Solirubrobacterales bacterium]